MPRVLGSDVCVVPGRLGVQCASGLYLGPSVDGKKSFTLYDVISDKNIGMSLAAISQ